MLEFHSSGTNNLVAESDGGFLELGVYVYILLLLLMIYQLQPQRILRVICSIYTFFITFFSPDDQHNSKQKLDL